MFLCEFSHVLTAALPAQHPPYYHGEGLFPSGCDRDEFNVWDGFILCCRSSTLVHFENLSSFCKLWDKLKRNLKHVTLSEYIFTLCSNGSWFQHPYVLEYIEALFLRLEHP